MNHETIYFITTQLCYDYNAVTLAVALYTARCMHPVNIMEGMNGDKLGYLNSWETTSSSTVE